MSNTLYISEQDLKDFYKNLSIYKSMGWEIASACIDANMNVFSLELKSFISTFHKKYTILYHINWPFGSKVPPLTILKIQKNLNLDYFMITNNLFQLLYPKVIGDLSKALNSYGYKIFEFDKENNFTIMKSNIEINMSDYLIKRKPTNET